MINHILIEREKLYQQVWSTPMVKLAQEYGLSDVGLTKICKKLNIPRPPQGYWMRKHKGKPSTLPTTSGPKTHTFMLEETKVESSPEFVDPHTAKLIQFEQQARNKIKVKKSLHNPDPLIIETKRQVATMEPDMHNRYKPWKPDALAINICQPSLNRGFLILDTIIKELQKRGLSIFRGDKKPTVDVLGEKLSFSLFEKVTRYEPDYSKAKYKNDYPHSRYRYKPTGTLSLLIDGPGYYSSASISDNRKKPLEDQLNDFFIKLYESADEIKKTRMERQQQEEKHQLQRKIRAEEKQQYEQEKRRQEKLELDAENWIKAKKIQAYIDAVEQSTTHQSDEQLAWIIWANNYVKELEQLI